MGDITVATSEAGTAYTLGSPLFISGFQCFLLFLNVLVFCVLLGGPLFFFLFVSPHLAIVLSVL
jgi:hypothetical protein